MDPLFQINGFLFWDEQEIHTREMIRDKFDRDMRGILRRINAAIDVRQVEAPIVTPRLLLNPNYTEEDLYTLADPTWKLALRPETTPGSYLYAAHLLETKSIKPPFCLFQAGKSYRREDEHPLKYMRLREFYQMEWQWLYTKDTANDNHTAIVEPTRRMIQEIVGVPCRALPSDRLPSYSEITTDIEADVDGRWMELASISRRTDFLRTVAFRTRKGVVEATLLNVEVAIGLDRCVYVFRRRAETAS